jgi:hypothetical protein
MFPNIPTPHLKNIYKFKGAKGLPKKNFFAFENRSYLGKFEAEFKKALARESGDQGVLFDEKNPRVENLVTLSL